MADTPHSRAARTPNKAPATKPAEKQPAPQTAGPAALGSQSLQGLLAEPLSATPAQLLQLQRQYGNAAVQQLLQRAQAGEEPPQPVVGLEGGELDAGLQGQIDAALGGGQALDSGLGAKMGAALGADFDDVRVHTDAEADTLNRSLGAKAFTLGSDVFFRQGAYDPGTSSGQHLLAHELTHVVQQGGVLPDGVQAKLTVGPAGDQFEEEADQMADRAMRTLASPPPVVEEPEEMVQRQAAAGQAAPATGPAIQRAWESASPTTATGSDQTRPRSKAIIGRRPPARHGRPRSKAIVGGSSPLARTRPRSDAIVGGRPALGRTRPRSDAIVERPPSLGGPQPQSGTNAGWQRATPTEQSGGRSGIELGQQRQPWTPPVIDPILTAANWKENRSFRDKLSSNNSLSDLLKVIKAIHNNIPWSKFDAAKWIRPNVNEGQHQAARNIQELDEAKQVAVDEDEVEQIESSRVKAELDWARLNTKQAKAALAAARAEYQANVARLLANVRDLVTLTQAQAGKGKAPSAHLGQMAAAAQRLQTQLESVPEVYVNFEQKIAACETAEQQAANTYRTTLQALKAKKDKRSELDLDDDEALDQATETPVTGPGQKPESEGGERQQAVQAIVGPGWFQSLRSVRFHEDRDVEEWTQSEDFQLSARDDRPDSTLRRLQGIASTAIDDFASALLALDGLKDASMTRAEALAQVRKHWLKVREACDLPGARGTGIVRAHREWLKQQTTLAGGRWADWKREHADLFGTYQKVERILQSDGGRLRSADAHLSRLK